MLRMTPLASAIVALLLGIEAYAAEETFDTHFMIGGMKDQQVANIRLDDNQPLPGQYDIDIYVNKQWRGKYEIIVKDNPQETCLSREIIKRLGINTDNFASGKQCLTFEQLVQGGSYTWDIGVFVSISVSRRRGWKNWKVAMFHRKTGSEVLMRFIPLIM